MKNLSVKKIPLRKLCLFLFDLACFLGIAGAYFLINILPEELIPGQYLYTHEHYWSDMVLLALCIFCTRWLLGVYFSVVRYADIATYFRVILSDAIAGVASMLIGLLVFHEVVLWSTVTVTALNALGCLGSRFVYRMLYCERRRAKIDNDVSIPVAIIGAGSIGVALLEELRYKQNGRYNPLFFVDIDKKKVGSRMLGLRIYGEDDTALDKIRREGVEELFIAISNPGEEVLERLYHFWGQTGCKLKIYDTSMQDLDRDKPFSGTLRDFKIEDLLFRKSRQVNNQRQLMYYANKVVMVTGGGGSIGSELCRQIVKCSPKRLIILDIYENNAYDIQQELIREYGKSLDLTVEIASVRDRVRMEAIFRAYRPEIVFHAAAHKHVPLMEHSACEAIKNNVFGTKNVADMAEAYGAEKFILISTDKAVNPTNVMGASKRMCERVIQCRRDSKTTYAAVRFGNVLGSNGSVIPLFRRQIAEGGPVTITDRRIIRYFMTIPEASQLVMQAGAMARSGELFVLDMGKPVHIYTLAENMIRLSGLRPHMDIEIREIGLRPGEKLYEELLIKTETLDKTDNNLIFIEKDTPPTREEIDQTLAMLAKAVEDAQDEVASDSIKQAMKQAVPEFKDPEEINRVAEEAEEMKMTKQ